MPVELAKSTGELSTPVVVVIDDEFTSRTILEQVVKKIREDIIVHAFADPLVAMAWIRNNKPDLIMVDYMMNGMNGLQAVSQIRQIPALEGIPIVVVTAIEERNIRYQALEAGATDFITKPIDPYECSVRCRNMLSLRLQQKIILDRSQYLEQRVEEATQQIRQRELETLFRLARAGEYRDEDTGSHLVRMAKYSRLIAQSLGLPEDRCELIEVAAPMHDIGKIGIPDYILLKQGRLNAEEFEIMKTHTTVGFEILQHSPSKYLSLGAEIALGHHEKFDGSGYPKGLAGDKIPLEARIVAVADVFDALTSQRPYKKAWANEDAISYLNANKGKHLDAECVETFLSRISDILAIQHLQSGQAGKP